MCCGTVVVAGRGLQVGRPAARTATLSASASLLECKRASMRNCTRLIGCSLRLLGRLLASRSEIESFDQSDLIMISLGLQLILLDSKGS